MPSKQTDTFEAWAIVEVFGHQKFAGRVTEQAIGGASFVRVDIPETNGTPAFTKLFGFCWGMIVEDKRCVAYDRTGGTEDTIRKYEKLRKKFQNKAKTILC